MEKEDIRTFEIAYGYKYKTFNGQTSIPIWDEQRKLQYWTTNFLTPEEAEELTGHRLIVIFKKGKVIKFKDCGKVR